MKEHASDGRTAPRAMEMLGLGPTLLSIAILSVLLFSGGLTFTVQ
jgi:hypothetical protein